MSYSKDELSNSDTKLHALIPPATNDEVIKSLVATNSIMPRNY